LGVSVASAGDVNGDGYSDVVVGASHYDNGEADEGRAFLYLGSAIGLTPFPLWTTEGNQAGAAFGWSVASAGDVNGDGYSDVVVGASEFDNGETNEGRGFLFLGSALGLSFIPAWTAEGNQVSASFGVSVASAGDVNGDGYSDVIVGAEAASNGESFEGRAFFYAGGPSGLSATPAWTAESNQASASFGISVASAGDVNGDGYSDVVVGAYRFDNGETNEGKAFLYLGSASGLNSTPAGTAEGNSAGVNFGNSVASAGDVNGDGYSDVAVGAYYFTNGESQEGRAFLYLGSASGLGSTPAWTAESNQAGALLGNKVGSAGDVNGDGYSDVVVGAHSFTNGESREGRAFLYLGSASGLSPTPAWTAEGNQVEATFGVSVASAGDVNGDGYSDVVIGANFLDNGETNEGGAFLFPGAASGLGAAPALTVESDQASAQFGISVASAGDVNGDGYSDIVVGAPSFDNGETDEGRAFVYLGSASGPSATPAWTAEGNQANANFGNCVASAGDVNGDGYSDVVVGANLYLGSASGLSTTPAWTSGAVGSSVASAGDVNGDGYSDVVTGSLLHSNGQMLEGGAFLFLGSSSGLKPVPDWAVESNQGNSFFGQSVASAGDVNGDGYSDVVVGAPSFNNGQTFEGRTYLYFGGAGGLSLTPAWTAESNQTGAFFGYSVASAGDVNGDGYSDVVVGARQFANGETREGSAFLYLGSATGLSTAPAWTAEGNQLSAWFGFSVGSAGDVNGDGYSDVVVGAVNLTNGETNEGRALLYLGSASGLSLAPSWTNEANQANAAFGWSVASAGDINGDGYSDVVVGAYGFTNGEAGEGRVLLFLGGDAAPGLPRGLQQHLSGATPTGAIASGVAPVTLSALAFNGLATQGRVALETEVKAVGTKFDGRALVRSAPGLALQRQAATWPTLAVGRYHWRARLVSGQERGRWISFGGNSEAEADFAIVLRADAGAGDAGAGDAGAGDAGADDAGADDAGVDDAGVDDAGVDDAGVDDAGAGSPDAGVDGGAGDDGPSGVRREYGVGCDCGSTLGFPTGLLGLLVWRASRRPRRARHESSHLLIQAQGARVMVRS
jgi:hypothetical protein